MNVELEHIIESREEHLHKQSICCRCKPYLSGKYMMHNTLMNQEEILRMNKVQYGPKQTKGNK